LCLQQREIIKKCEFRMVIGGGGGGGGERRSHHAPLINVSHNPYGKGHGVGY
jgi:hypothetical protein